MKTYSTYIFDLDGTISDSASVWLTIFRDCMAKLGVDHTQFGDDEIAKHTHDWKVITKLGVPEESIPQFAAYATELANIRLPQAQLFSGAVETLEALRATGKRVAIFSTMDQSIFEPAMKHHNLYSLTEVAVAGNDVPNRKPAPDGILKALHDLGVPESERSSVVYMGDKDTDIQAARNAGVASILFYPPAHQLFYDKDTALAHNPTHVISDWQELLESFQN